MRVAKADASKCVIGPIPERPLTMPSQLAARPLPTGDRMPRPVMTTRRLDIADSVADSIAMRGPRRGGCAPETPEAAIAAPACTTRRQEANRSEEHTTELQSLQSTLYAVFCW